MFAHCTGDTGRGLEQHVVANRNERQKVTTIETKPQTHAMQNGQLAGKNRESVMLCDVSAF